MAFVLWASVSASRKRREYEDKVETEDADADDAKLSGDDERDASDEEVECKRFSLGKSTAIVPPKVGRLVSPHMLIMDVRLQVANARCSERMSTIEARCMSQPVQQVNSISLNTGSEAGYI